MLSDCRAKCGILLLYSLCSAKSFLKIRLYRMYSTVCMAGYNARLQVYSVVF